MGCTRQIDRLRDIASETGWFPIAGAIASNNVSFVKRLVEEGVNLQSCHASDFVAQYLNDDSNPVGIKGLLAMKAAETIEVSTTVHDVAVAEVEKLELTRPR